MDNALNLGFNFGSTTGSSQQTFDKPISPPEGLSYWRLLSPVSSELPLFKKYSLHWGFTSATGKKTPVQCTYWTEKFCPVCTRVREFESLLKRAEQAGDTAKMEEYKEFISNWGVRNTFVYNALDVNNQVQILSVGKKTHDQIIQKITEAVQPPKGPNGAPLRPAFDPTSLTDGVWLQINRTGKGFKTEYKVDFRRTSVQLPNGDFAEQNDRRPVNEAVAEAIRNQIKLGGTGPLKDIYNLYEIRTSADLQAMLNGTPVNRGTVSNTTTNHVQSQTVTAPPVNTAPVAQAETTAAFDQAAEARKRLEERLKASQSKA